MKGVGIRELKNKFSEYLSAVQAGEEVLSTDRGEVVAEVLERAPRLFPGEPIRSLDAIHLASALVARSSVAGLAC